jgi:hypothetical protein
MAALLERMHVPKYKGVWCEVVRAYLNTCVQVSRIHIKMLPNRVARRQIFKPIIPIWVNFGGSCKGRCWYTYFMANWSVLRQFRIFCGHSVYFRVISFFLFWYVVPRKIWQPCSSMAPTNAALDIITYVHTLLHMYMCAKRTFVHSVHGQEKNARRADFKTRSVWPSQQPRKQKSVGSNPAGL